MKNKKRKLFLAIVGIILIVGIVSAVLFAYKKSTEPIPSLHCNLHEAAVLAQAADFLQLETEKTTLKKKLAIIEKRLEISSLDFNELVFYLTICQKLSFGVDDTVIEEAAGDFYNSGEMLFSAFLEGGDDPITDLSSTISLLQVYPKVLNWQKYSIGKGIEKAIKEMKYSLPNEGKTFYNSGGVALAAIRFLNEQYTIDYTQLLPEEITEWYETWELFFQEKEFSFLSFTGFYPTALVIEGEYPLTDLQNYYESLTPEMANVTHANNVLLALQYLPLVDVEKNPTYYDTFKASVIRMIDEHQFVKDH